MYLSIDLGTTSTKCFVYNEKGLVTSAQVQTSLITPHSGWVEQNAVELFESVLQCLSQLQGHLEGSKSKMPVACGITNQRETVVAFRKSTGEPLYNAISWMDVRTAPLVNELKSASDQICSKFETITGLKVSTFFSAFKIKWILENIPIVQQASEDQDLAICTLDSWILWKLTQGSSFYTDPSNASRTFLYSIVDNNYEWYPDLLKYFGVHVDWLPVIRSFGGIYGEIHEGLPFAGCKIAALIGDQQSSLIGHWGRSFEGKLKCTFGTGAFLLRSIESKGSALDNPGALKTVLFNENYIEEFPIVCAGSLVKWMQNSLGFIGSASELNQIDFYPRNPPNDSVYFIPNLSGCLFPAWDPSLRGSFHNLSLQSDKMEMILAVLESVAFCIRRALDNLHVSVLSVDGGMCTNRHFCQLLANICNCEIRILGNSDATGLGAAILASNFLIDIVDNDNNNEIISPQPDLTLIYTQKYTYWCSLQQ